MGSGRAELFSPRIGRFDGRIGDGNRPRACRVTDAGIGPSARADGTVRQLAWGGYSRGEAIIRRCADSN